MRRWVLADQWAEHQNPAMMQQMLAQQQAHNMLQYQQHLQQMQQQGHQGPMMSGVPGAGVIPK